MITMRNDRLTKKIFLHDHAIGNTKNWCSDVKIIMERTGNLQNFNTLSPIDLSQAKQTISDIYTQQWSTELQGKPKLRTYKQFKMSRGIEDYVTLNISKHERSILCQFRCGILPLRIETGRYTNEPPDNRLCRFCPMLTTEDEIHFAFYCDLYDDIRRNMFSDIIVNHDFVDTSDYEKLKYLMTEYPRKFAKFLTKAYLCRRTIMYS